MLDKPDNPYVAPQTVPRQKSGIMMELIKRAALGLLIAVVIFQILAQFNWQLESGDERYRGMMYCSYAVLVAVTSVFTQSESAKAAGKSGLIPACLLWVVALILGCVITRFIGIIPYPRLRSISFTLEMSAKEFGIVTFIDLFFVALLCRLATC